MKYSTVLLARVDKPNLVPAFDSLRAKYNVFNGHGSSGQAFEDVVQHHCDDDFLPGIHHVWLDGNKVTS